MIPNFHLSPASEVNEMYLRAEPTEQDTITLLTSQILMISYEQWKKQRECMQWQLFPDHMHLRSAVAKELEQSPIVKQVNLKGADHRLPNCLEIHLEAGALAFANRRYYHLLARIDCQIKAMAYRGNRYTKIPIDSMLAEIDLFESMVVLLQDSYYDYEVNQIDENLKITFG